MPQDTVTLYHNPKCGTSRTVLARLRNAGIEPNVIEYLKNPPDRTVLKALLDNGGMTVREVLRTKEPLYQELGLGDASLPDDKLLDAIEQHPILMNRPLVVAPGGTRLCRPADVILEIVPQAVALPANA